MKKTPIDPDHDIVPQSLATRLQHAGGEHRQGLGLVGAIETSVTFSSPGPNDPPTYSRLGNTNNHKEVEALLASLYDAKDAIVTGSGMSALSLFVMSLVRPGDHVLCLESCYGGTYNFLTKIMKPWGLQVDFLPFDKWQNGIKANTRFAIVESITNPMCVAQPLTEIVSFCRQHRIVSLCDNTFASPIVCNPLSFGFDYVMESATKYLNGHSDVVAGVLASKLQNMAPLRSIHAYLGSFLATSEASQLLRGLKTLQVRVNAQSSNAAKFAEIMTKSPLVKSLSYGSFQSEAIKQQFPNGFGGMVTITFQDNVDVHAMLSGCRLIRDVPSLGGTETTATRPFYSTNWFMTSEEKKHLGISEQTVRFSIGLEEPVDLVNDLQPKIDSQRRS